MSSAKEKFEKEREKILEELPDSIKDMFGTIGFCMNEDEDIVEPVLIVSPYDVPPKPVRDIYWHDLFNKSKKSGKTTLANMAYLIYHYGHVEDLYSFCDQDDFITYELGKEKGYDILPSEITEKVQQQQGGVELLTEEEMIRVRAIQELQEDLQKSKSERKRGPEFVERHEQQQAQQPSKQKAKATGGGGQPSKKKQKKK